MEAATAMDENESSSPPPELTWTIVLENIGLVHFVVNKYCSRYEDRKDLVQEGLLGLFQAARQFDPSRDVAFSTFAYPKILNRVLGFFQDRPREFANGDYTDHHPDQEPPSGLESHEVSFIRDELLSQLQESMKSELDELERLVLTLRWLHQPNITLEDMAKQMRVSPQTVMRIEHEAIAKLRESFKRRRT